MTEVDWDIIVQKPIIFLKLVECLQEKEVINSLVNTDYTYNSLNDQVKGRNELNAFGFYSNFRKGDP